LRKGEIQLKKKISTKMLVMLLVSLMVIGSVVGGTLAWLVDKSDVAVNTFTYGDVNIDLDETDTDRADDDNPDTNEYEMIPGETITKDPKVTVKAESKALWLFVKLDKSENFDDFMEYEIADGWTQLKDAEGNDIVGVYYRDVAEVGDNDQVFGVLLNDEVKVKESVTKEMLNALDPEGQEATYPTLSVTAYAVQMSGFEPVVSEGATAPTAEQINTAALSAWEQTGA
jgi:hypothetical protein